MKNFLINNIFVRFFEISLIFLLPMLNPLSFTQMGQQHFDTNHHQQHSSKQTWFHPTAYHTTKTNAEQMACNSKNQRRTPDNSKRNAVKEIPTVNASMLVVTANVNCVFSFVASNDCWLSGKKASRTIFNPKNNNSAKATQ